MQRESIRRGFSISHQKVVLDIDFTGSFRGYTEITIIPLNKDLKTVYLHSRQCQIYSVTVGSHPTEFAYHDPMTNVLNSDITDCHRHPELKRKLYSALAESDEGELAIAIPKQVPLRPSLLSSGLNAHRATPEPSSTGRDTKDSSLEFAPIVIKVEYSLRHPVDGFQFVLPNDANPYRAPHAYTTPSSPDSARCWVPCIDNLWEKCTWEFEFVVPKYLEEQAPAGDMEMDVEDGVNEGGSHPTIVICSGELVEQVAHPWNSNKTIFLFSQAVLTSVQQIAFAAGPFHVFPIPTDVQGVTEEGTGSNALMHAFCLPGQEALLATSVSFTRSAMNFYSTEFGSYPFGSYKLVFVDELPVQRFDSATLTLATSGLLHNDDDIDQVFDTRHDLSHALACQWTGINIIPKTWSDTWLVNGLGLYITGLYIKKLFGNNEYRFRMKKDMARILERDNGAMPPICQPNNFEPPDASVLPFINLKAPLVLHILDRRLGKSGTSLGLSRVLPKVFLSAISGEMPNNALSTHSFLRTCRKVSGVDLRTFVEQWIYGSGCPQFSFLATFNRKKMAVEIQMRQECVAHAVHENDPIAMNYFKPVQFFEGQMTVRIHEADGTPYEHVLDILTPVKRFEVPFNTKYKRVRRNTKRYLARQAAAQAAAEGDSEAAEAIGMIDMGFGLEIWEEEEERDRWKVADWTEEEEQAMAGATYEWIRMDADFEWIAKIQFEQPDYMWVSQLQRDRDVVAQYEAVHALSRSPTAIVSSTLTKTVLVSNYFFRIRCEAALAIVSCATRRLDFIGLFHLFKLFLRYCYDPEDPEQDLFTHKYVPRPNDFSDLAEYFVRKALLNAISQVRFENGKTPPVIRQFFVDQLRYNDNTINHYSDAYYICAVIAALSCSSVSTAPPERGELLKVESRVEQNAEDVKLLNAAVAEVERYRSMDRLIPSPHNIVSVAALEFHLVIAMANLVSCDPKIFLTSTREGNATQVRLAGFDGLFLMRWHTPKIMRYIFSIMANDPSRIIRRHVVRNVCESLALLATIGEIKHAPKDAESLLIEEDGTNDKTKEIKKSEVDLVIRALRKDKEVGKSDILRECLMPVILDPTADCQVRWCLLKLADMAIRGVEEPLPKVTIHLPPTPVSETPPPLPLPLPPVRIVSKVKPSPLGNRKLSVAAESPTTPLTIPPKFKIPGLSTPTTPIAVHTRNVPTVVRSVPKKKERHVPKAQSGGMSAVELKACQSALKKLVSSKHSAIFRQPVDPVRDRAPNYFEVIKSPMDLSTMSAKLSAGLYKDRSAFEADFRLIIGNCQTYNPAGTFAHNESLNLEGFFTKQWSRISNTLEAANIRAVQRNPVKVPPPRPPTSQLPPPTIKVAVPKPKATDVPPTPTPIRPTIKLNLGGRKSATPQPAAVHPEPPKEKDHPKRKAKLIDVPPPPYIDDGSHDLLQEVIAIERELGEGRRTSPAKIPNGKVRKLHADEDAVGEDDELLSLALPIPPHSRKPPERSPGSTPGPSTQPKPTFEPKPKRPTEVGARTSTPSVKGKEKETVPANLALSKPKKQGPAQGVSINEKKCKEVLKTLLKLPQAIIFSRPVDPNLDGCPTYYDEIKNPMDFATMRTRLDKSHYNTMEEFSRDMELVFSNCRLFNPPGTDPVICADIVERAFKKEWSKVSEKKLSFQEKRNLQGIMTKLQAENTFWVFREPVDPVVLGIPTYHDVIPKKDARDLRTIRTKLDNDKYDSTESWDADINLMVRNAVKFNGIDNEVAQIGLQLQARARELVKSSGGQQSSGNSGSQSGQGQNKNLKRPAGDGSRGSGSGSGQTVKKMKVG